MIFKTSFAFATYWARNLFQGNIMVGNIFRKHNLFSRPSCFSEVFNLEFLHSRNWRRRI